MSMTHGWLTLAEPTYATSRFGRTVEFPAGTVIRSLNPPTNEPFPGAIRVVAADGSPFELETATIVRPDGTSPSPVDVPALWWVTASALRFVAAGAEDGRHSLMGREVL